MIGSPGVRGRSIKLFLADGTANGVIVASIPNWTGSIIVGRSLRLNELLDRAEAERPGCYILQGEDDSHPMGVRAYIGQASVLRNRLLDHVRTRDWWSLAALISTSDANFTAGHYLALESRMIQIAIENDRAKIENVRNPGEFAGNLGEADRADLESFLDQIRLVLPVLGVNLLTDSLARKADSEPLLENDSPEDFQISHRSGVTADARIRADEFIVLEGSLAIADDRYQHNGYAALRQDLISRGVLAPNNENTFLRFTRDTAFASSSAAAAVILNRQASGPKEWKLVNSGISLGQWREPTQASFGTNGSGRSSE
ncbi:GIY-YIG nuclease family protein [Aurantimonas coralicida]|uniref:GIY-YIG nuclease family protein n=1 Tax=Aurantimonas coralicida TaxID=182270 RepID=UPI0023A6F97C|nr:GIY-YIG nuclease family protein [Aurantimonas coralicida]MDE0924655.1 GIY-YIG nuclease family protein [Aurantimonas coralicida]